MAEAVPLWIKGSFPYCPEGFSYYLLGSSVLVGDFGSDGVAFAANSDKGIQFLKCIRGRTGIFAFKLEPYPRLDLARFRGDW